MTPEIRRSIIERLNELCITRAELARRAQRTPQVISRALNGGQDGGVVPQTWQAILEVLELELIVRPKGEKPK